MSPCAKYYCIEYFRWEKDYLLSYWRSRAKEMNIGTLENWSRFQSRSLVVRVQSGGTIGMTTSARNEARRTHLLHSTRAIWDGKKYNKEFYFFHLCVKVYAINASKRMKVERLSYISGILKLTIFPGKIVQQWNEVKISGQVVREHTEPSWCRSWTYLANIARQWNGQN